MNIERWPIDRVIPYARNARVVPQSAIDKVAASIKEFGWQQPIVVDKDRVIIAGHTRLLAARKLGLTEVPVLVADGLTPTQVAAYRLMDNRSHEETSWDFDLLGLEMVDLRTAGWDLGLTGFDAKELADIWARTPTGKDGLTPDDAAPTPPVAPVAQTGDVWRLGPHRVICGSSTDPAAVARLLGDRKPVLLCTDPPYGISLDSEWRDRAGLNGGTPSGQRTALTKENARTQNGAHAEPSYMKHRTEGHTETTISGDTRADWSEAFELVPSRQVAYVWHASAFTREVLTGLERIGFLYPQQIIWNKGRVVLTRTHYWYQHEPCWYVRKKNAPWHGKAGECATVWDAPSPKFIMGGQEEKFDHPTQEAARSDADSDCESHRARGDRLRLLPRQRDDADSRRENRSRLLRRGNGSEVRGRDHPALAAVHRAACRARRRRADVRSRKRRAPARAQRRHHIPRSGQARNRAGA